MFCVSDNYFNNADDEFIYSELRKVAEEVKAENRGLKARIDKLEKMVLSLSKKEEVEPKKEGLEIIIPANEEENE